MDMTSIMREIETWPIDDQIELAQRVWTRIAESGWQPALTESDKAELDRRIAADDANPDEAVTWESILEHLGRTG